MLWAGLRIATSSLLVAFVVLVIDSMLTMIKMKKYGWLLARFRMLTKWF